jgi:hypothetical protein
LFDRDHLALHLGKFGRSLSVAANEKRSRPKDNDFSGSGDSVIRPLLVLRS